MTTSLEGAGLALNSLKLHNFRSYETFEINDIGSLTLFIGPNAAGKTNIVEAIQLVSALSSFRTSQSSQMVLWGQQTASVNARVSSSQRNLDIQLNIVGGRREYHLNGKKRSIQELKGLLPAVTFCPDDLNLVKGSHTIRRNALDLLGSQLSQNYYAVKNDYAKLVRQKNRALKDELDDAFIDSIDDVIARVGSQLILFRAHVLELICPLLTTYYEDISHDSRTLELIYEPSWDNHKQEINRYAKEEVQENLAHALTAARPADRARKKATAGPHADALTFMLGGHEAVHYASQGQQRSIVLSFKLAEASIIQQTTGQTPLLILDDVMSELDEERRQYFLEFITGDIQTFITSTNSGYFPSYLTARATVYQLSTV